MEKIKIRESNEKSKVKYINLLVNEVESFTSDYTKLLYNLRMLKGSENNNDDVFKGISEKLNRKVSNQKTKADKNILDLFSSITKEEIISFVENNEDNIFFWREREWKRWFLNLEFRNFPTATLGGVHSTGLSKLYVTEEPSRISYAINIMLNALERYEEDLLILIRPVEFDTINKRLENNINRLIAKKEAITLKEKLRKEQLKAELKIARAEILQQQKELRDELNAFRSEITEAEAEFIVINSNLNNLRKTVHKEIIEDGNFKINKIYFNRYGEVTLAFDNYIITLLLNDNVIQPRLHYEPKN